MGDHDNHPSLKNGSCAEEAVIKVLQSVCGAEIERDEDLSPQQCDIASVISLVGDVEWSLWLGFPEASAVGLTAEFAGMELEPDSEDMADAVGELAIMIGGDTKTRLADFGIGARLSLPSVMSGQGLKVRARHDQPNRIVHFNTQWGAVWVELMAGVKVGEVRQVGS